jgi:hypothetical protein
MQRTRKINTAIGKWVMQARLVNLPHTLISLRLRAKYYTDLPLCKSMHLLIVVTISSIDGNIDSMGKCLTIKTAHFTAESILPDIINTVCTEKSSNSMRDLLLATKYYVRTNQIVPFDKNCDGISATRLLRYSPIPLPSPSSRGLLAIPPSKKSRIRLHMSEV